MTDPNRREDETRPLLRVHHRPSCTVCGSTRHDAAVHFELMPCLRALSAALQADRTGEAKVLTGVAIALCERDRRRQR